MHHSRLTPSQCSNRLPTEKYERAAGARGTGGQIVACGRTENGSSEMYRWLDPGSDIRSGCDHILAFVHGVVIEDGAAHLIDGLPKGATHSYPGIPKTATLVSRSLSAAISCAIQENEPAIWGFGSSGGGLRRVIYRFKG
jgi:hypothetical protein